MVCYKTLLIDKKIQLDILKCAKSFFFEELLNAISPGLFGPCILPGWGKIAPCHKSSLANALIMKLGQLVDQVKWGLQVYNLLP